MDVDETIYLAEVDHPDRDGWHPIDAHWTRELAEASADERRARDAGKRGPWGPSTPESHAPDVRVTAARPREARQIVGRRGCECGLVSGLGEGAGEDELRRRAYIVGRHAEDMAGRHAGPLQKRMLDILEQAGDEFWDGSDPEMLMLYLASDEPAVREQAQLLLSRLRG